MSELGKFRDASDKIELIESFVAWLEEHDRWIGVQVDNNFIYDPVPAGDLAMQFLGIDKDTLEAERKALLKQAREANG